MKLILAIFASLALAVAAIGQSRADLIIINATIRTLDDKRPRAEAIAIAGDRIVAVGTDREIRRLAGPETKTIDAKGRLVIPGFNDSHVHFTGIGNQFSHLDLSHVKSSDDVIKRVSHFTQFLPNGRWLIGARLDPRGWEKPKLPTLTALDAVSPNNPLLLYFADPKRAFVNSAALNVLTKALYDRAVGKGEIIFDAEGIRTGIVEGEAVTAIRAAIPADHGTNWLGIAETASNYAASLGVTSVQDVHTDNLLSELRTLESGGRLKTRIYECVGIKDSEKIAAVGMTAASGTGMVRGGCVKGLAEGGADEIDGLRRRIAESDRLGLQVMIHAIGGDACANTLDAFEYAAKINPSRDRRFRVEHANRLRRDDFLLVNRLGIIASMQPHLFYFGGSGGGDDYRGLLSAGVKLAFGSDASITDFNPLLGIYAATNSGAQSISVEQAVKAYTIGSAYAEFQDDVKGTLTVGKLADMIVVSDDIFGIPKSRIADARILVTIVNGRVVFTADRF